MTAVTHRTRGGTYACARSVTWQDTLGLVRSRIDVDVHFLVLRAPHAGPAPTARAATRHPRSACGPAALAHVIV
jgi:hypothetical protein